MPLAMLGKMIEQALEWDLEAEIRPLWYLRAVTDALNKRPTVVTLQEMISDLRAPKQVRSAEEITNTFAAIIERDRRKHG